MSEVVKKISTILGQVKDMDRAVGFYRDLLGLAPDVVSPHWSSLSVGNTQIGLHPPFEGGSWEPGRGWILGIEVDDLKGLKAVLQANGVPCAPFHDVPGGCVMDFADPDGNSIQAMQLGVSAQDLA